MALTPEEQDEVKKVALGPESTTVDTQTVRERKISELREALGLVDDLNGTPRGPGIKVINSPGSVRRNL